MAEKEKNEILKVGILLPFYNDELYLSECLESLASQTYRDIVVLAVNDFSTDDSLNILENFRQKYPELEIRLHNNESNWGGAMGYNRAYKMAVEDKCDAVVVIGHDDTLEAECVAKMVDRLNTTSDDFCIVYGKMFGQGNQIMPSKENAKLEDFREVNVIANFPILRIEAWHTIGGYDEWFIYGDWDFWIRAIKSGLKYSVIKEPLYNYRLHDTNIHKSVNHELEHKKILERHFL